MVPQWPLTDKLVLVGLAVDTESKTQVKSVVAFTHYDETTQWAATHADDITLYFQVLRSVLIAQAGLPQ